MYIMCVSVCNNNNVMYIFFDCFLNYGTRLCAEYTSFESLRNENPTGRCPDYTHALYNILNVINSHLHVQDYCRMDRLSVFFSSLIESTAKMRIIIRRAAMAAAALVDPGQQHV